MRKIRLFTLFVFIIAVLFTVYKFDIYLKKANNSQSSSREAAEEEYRNAVSKLDDAAIIKKELKAVGVLTVLEGEEQYKQIIEEENWFSYREINIDWRYRFAIAINLEDVGISINNEVTEVSIESSKLFIQFIEKTKESTSHSEASWLAEQVTSQEVEALETAILEKVETQIKETLHYWEEASKSLEVNIRKICNDLGYYNIHFIWDAQAQDTADGL